MQVELVDALDYLAGVELVPGTAGQPPPSTDSEGDVYYELQEVDDRIVNVLGNAAWPSSLSTIFSGNVFVKETFYPPGTTALAALADAADAEFPGVANVFVDKLGNVTFHGRHAPTRLRRLQLAVVHGAVDRREADPGVIGCLVAGQPIVAAAVVDGRPMRGVERRH